MTKVQTRNAVVQYLGGRQVGNQYRFRLPRTYATSDKTISLQNIIWGIEVINYESLAAVKLSNLFFCKSDVDGGQKLVQPIQVTHCVIRNRTTRQVKRAKHHRTRPVIEAD